MYDLTTTILIGMLSSLLAPLMFLVAMLRLRPHIVLSDHTAKHQEDEGNKTTYQFKIVNYSRRDTVNLKIEMNIITTVGTPKGVSHNHKVVNSRKATRMDLPRYVKSDLDGSYAVRFTIDADLDKEWESDKNQFLRLKVFAQDAVSRFGKLFVKNYRVKRIAIKEGQFEFGKSMEII